MGLVSGIINVARGAVKSGTLDDAARVVSEAAPGLADDAARAMSGLVGGLKSTLTGAADGWKGASGGLVSKVVHAAGGASKSAGEAVLGSSAAKGAVEVAGRGVDAVVSGLRGRGMGRLGDLVEKSAGLVGRAGGAAAATGVGKTAVGAATLAGVGIGVGELTGHDTLGDVTETVGNVVGTGANLLEGGAAVAGGAAGLVGSGTEAITDLASTLTGVAADVTSGNLGGVVERIGQYATEHPIATAVGVGGGAMLLGGGGGLLSKVALAGVGLMAGKTLIDKMATSDNPETSVTEGLSGGAHPSAEPAVSEQGLESTLAAYEADQARAAQASATVDEPTTQTARPAVSGPSFGF